jgi:Zn-dependent protease
MPIIGPRFAAMLVLIFLIHELGHVGAARYLRLPVGWMLFVPLLGALVVLKEQPRIVEQDAVLALGGPAAGAVFALACSITGLATGNADLSKLGEIGAIINLLNLVPLPPLDGSRVLAIVSPRLALLGVPVWGVLIFRHLSYDLVLIALIGLPLLVEALRGDRGDRETIAFYAAPLHQQVAAVAAYAVTCGDLFLALVMGRVPHL